MSRTDKDDINLIYVHESSDGSRYITDWSPIPKGIKFPTNTYGSFGMHNVSQTYMGLYRTEGGDFHTSGYVGVGWLKDYTGRTVTDSEGRECAIMIKPRFESMDPWSMLSKVLSDKEYDDYIKENGPFYTFEISQKLIPVPATEKGGEMLAALSFLKACERICRKSLSKKMSFEENNFNGKVVGNIQVSKQIKHNVVAGREDRIYCRYPIFTVDTLENRILKAALKEAHKILQAHHNRSAELMKINAYCSNALKSVTTVKIVKSDFNKVDVTGCNAHYKNVIQLAKVILFNEGISDLYNERKEGTRMVIPYTINMERLFEFYVRSIIKDSLNGKKEEYALDEYRNNNINPLNVIGNNEEKTGLYIMENYIPDIAIYEMHDDEKRYVAVFDVKYQHSTNKAYSSTVRHNSHQLLFYMLLLNVNTCGFIFPKEDKAKECGDGVQLQIQKGNRIIDQDENGGYYTQWLIDIEDEKKSRNFADRVVTYLRKIKQND